MTTPSPLSPATRHLPAHDALEVRFGERVAAHLDGAAAELAPDIVARLGRARQAAMLRLRHERQAATDTVVVGLGSAARSAPTSEPRWQRALAWVPLVAMVIGVWAIGEHQSQRRLRAAAEIDARLLTDVLPPAAYADPGFNEFLREGGQR
jgi:hypothetical protein